MRIVLLILAAVVMLPASAQNLSPELQAMVAAENSFAGYSKEHNTRDAFLRYMTDSTVMFDKENFTKGKASWEKRSADATLLFWWPQLAGISASGDLGFSTGPWQWAPSKTDQPRAHGYYATVWKKIDGSWKIAIDLGIVTPQAPAAQQTLRVSNPSITDQNYKRRLPEKIFLVDEDYIKKLSADSSAFNKEYFVPDAIVLRQGMMPEQYPFANTPGWKVVYEKLYERVASSHDLAYTYGKARVVDAGKVRNLGFMRVWKWDGKAWKIILDVIGGNE